MEDPTKTLETPLAGIETPQEIEKKFLVKYLPEGLEQYPHKEINQGYLAIAPEAEIRLRQKGEKYFQTVKTGEGQTRGEVEISISVEQFAALWSMTEGKRVEKTRYEIALTPELVAELDIFGGALDGLKSVEVEFTSEVQADAFEAPEWFGEDVTSDKRYKNQQLAVKGIPTEE